jgi:hypothetical protein
MNIEKITMGRHGTREINNIEAYGRLELMHVYIRVEKLRGGSQDETIIKISVITDQINSVIEEYDMESISRSYKHQHSLSAREAFSSTPSISWKYLNFVLVW